MTDARRYSWPPFTAGHELSPTTSGAWSERKLQPLVEHNLLWLAEAAPWATGVSATPAARAWAHAEARVALLRLWFDDHPQLDGEGEPAAALVALDRAESRAASLRDQLGLGPMAMVKLMAGLSSIDGPAAQQGLDALRAEGLEIRQAAEQRALTAVPDPDDAA